MNTSVKTCFKCHQEKALTEFYKHSRMSDGVLGKCKECAKDDVQRNYRSNIEHYKEYERGRALLPHRIKARSDYAKTDMGRIAGNRAKRIFLDRNPEKRAAHIKAGNAIRDGRLTRQPCEVCGVYGLSANGRNIVQAHHDDYSKPLEVRWLCTVHHSQHHKEVAQ